MGRHLNGVTGLRFDEDVYGAAGNARSGPRAFGDGRSTANRPPPQVARRTEARVRRALSWESRENVWQASMVKPTVAGSGQGSGDVSVAAAEVENGPRSGLGQCQATRQVVDKVAVLGGDPARHPGGAHRGTLR
jgi:hypothetical protein